MSEPSALPATAQPRSDCTLATYAAAKRLPVDFLRELRLRDLSYMSSPALRMPYLDETGAEIAVRFRLALGPGQEADNRFRWRRGDKPRLYGLWRLQGAREAGHVVLVEGESDAQTLWSHGVHALGIPGASTWVEDWAAALDGIGTIVVVIEPDRGGAAVRKWIARSRIRDRVRLVTLEGVKDPSELHIADPATFLDRWQAALERAVPWADQAADEANARRRAAWERCADLVRSPRILDSFAKVLPEAGLAGEDRAAKLIYLCVVSRLLERPASCVVKGPSSAGKSHVVGIVLRFFPSSAYHVITAMSERNLAYSEEPLKHRILVVHEAVGIQGEFVSYLIRSLLSEGRIQYETVEKTSKGLRPRVIEREGPTGLLLTTTAIRVHREVETRVISIPVCDTQEQTREVMRALAVKAEGKQQPDFDLTCWHALQEWLGGAEHRVSIPFARKLAEAIPPAAVRMRRDFGALLNLIRTHALLHQATRDRDAQGRIVATLDDYEVVRALVGDLIAQGVQSAVPPAVRETVDAISVLAHGQAGVTATAVAKRLCIDKSSATRRVRDAGERGYLKNNEQRKGMPGRWVVADPMPEELELLPEPSVLEPGCTVGVPTGDRIPPPPSREQIPRPSWFGLGRHWGRLVDPESSVDVKGFVTQDRNGPSESAEMPFYASREPIQTRGTRVLEQGASDAH